MNSHYQFTDEEFETEFRNRKLDAKLFTHEAHLRLAWIHLRQYGLETTEVTLCKQILAYAKSLGDGSKFNTTVTIAAIKAVHHFMCRSEADTFMEFVSEFPRLKTGFKDLMAAHYGFEIFNNPKAKKTYLAHDLAPF